MPDRLDIHLSAEIVKRHILPITTDPAGAACVLTSGQKRTRVVVDSTGSAVIPERTTVTTEETGSLPRTARGHKSAAVQLVYSKTAVVLWGSSKGNMWITEGVPDLARKLAKDLQKECRK